jgi:regulator of extracellular matrix RemA (YlzA/DUF370 family)
MKNIPNLPYLSSSNNYSTVQQSTKDYHGTNGTLVKRSTTIPTGSTVMQVNHDIVQGPSTSPRTNRQINERKTQRQMVDATYDMDDDSTVKMDNISASAIHGEISAIQDEVSAVGRKKKAKIKMVDIIEAHYHMGHMGEVALRRYLSHHNIKATGKFQNFVSCMKWKAQNKPVNKIATNPAKHPGERLDIEASGPLPLPMGRKEYWLKIIDEFSGYSWDYFMSEKSSTTAILKRQLQWMKASGILSVVIMRKSK